MHIISRKRLRDYGQRHANVRDELERWYNSAKKSRWQHLVDVQKAYKSAESVGRFTVFNIKGGHYRLIVGIDYEGQVIYIKYVLTHAEYEKDAWKRDPEF